MKKLLIAAVTALLFIAAPAQAGGLFGGDTDNSISNSNKNYNTNLNGAAAKANASLKARTSSSARADQYQKAISLQGQSNEAVGSGNVVTSTYEQKYQAPGIALGQGDPGYDCSMTGGVGLSVPGGGGSVQWSDASINCELAMIYKLGRKDPATQNRAYEAYDILFDRVMEQAGAEDDPDRQPSKRSD